MLKLIFRPIYDLAIPWNVPPDAPFSISLIDSTKNSADTFVVDSVQSWSYNPLLRRKYGSIQMSDWNPQTIQPKYLVVVEMLYDVGKIGEDFFNETNSIALFKEIWETFVNRAKDVDMVANQFVPPLLDAILVDYRSNIAEGDFLFCV